MNDNDLAAYVDGALPDHRRAHVETHLSLCHPCRTLVSDCAKSLAPSQGDSHETGKQLGRYRLESLIGRGSMGTVYLAEDIELQRKVALKFLHTETLKDGKGPWALGSTPELTAGLRNEAIALARLSHPSVVNVHEMGMLDGQSFVAMEFVDGQTLHQWIKATARSWRARLKVLVEAGEGVAAAHRAGVIHRDLKPSNLLIDAPGRVRIVDFGLAYTDGPRSESKPSAPSPGTETMTSIAGTPAYMAPEVKDGQPATTKSDQYSFCVMAYEALQGTRPKPKVPIAGVPKRVRQAISRGLSPAPSDRFASMDALCKELESSLGAARWRWGAAAVLAVAAVGVGFAATNSATETCSLRRDRLAKVWNPEARSAVLDGLGSVTRPYAKETARRVVGLLDLHGDQWLSLQQETCRATHVHGEQSATLLDLRMSCFQRQIDRLSEQVKIFGNEANATILDQAIRAAGEVMDSHTCQSLESQAGTQAASDESQELRAKAARARALHRSGQYQESAQVGRLALKLAQSEGATAAQAEIGLVLALAESRLENHQASLQAIDEASTAASAVGDSRTLIQLWTHRILVEGIQLNNVEAGQAWSTATLQKLAFLNGSDEALRAEVLGMLGRFHSSASHDDKAAQYFDEALQASASLPTGNKLVRASILQHAADFWRFQRKIAPSLEALEESLALQLDVLGPGHPKVALAKSAFAASLLENQDFVRARKLQEEALASLIAVYGPDHSALIDTHSYLSDTLRSLGEVDAAFDHANRCLQILKAHPDVVRLPKVYNLLSRIEHRRDNRAEALKYIALSLELSQKEHGATHRSLIGVYSMQGIVQRELRMFEEAKQSFQSAMEIHDLHMEPGSDSAAPLWHNFASVLAMQGHYDEATVYFQKVYDVIKAVRGPDHVNLAYALLGLGKCAISTKRFAAAAEYLEEALRVREGSRMNPRETAMMRFELGRAHWGAGDKHRGRAEVRAAHKSLDSIEATEELAVKMEKWLASHQ